MAETAVRSDVLQALFDLQRYLSDQVAPMMMVEAVELLLDQPPALVAAEIQGWAAAQYRGTGAGLPVSDYYFHAVKKIHMMSEFELLDRTTLTKYLGGLMRAVVAMSPADEQKVLVDNLRLLGRSTSTVAPVTVLHRQVGTATLPSTGASSSAAGPAAAGPTSAEYRRFSLLLTRVGEFALAGGGLTAGAPASAVEPASAAALSPGMAAALAGVSTGTRGDILPGLLVAAATSARTDADLNDLLRRIGEAGLDTRPEQALRVLARSLPEWSAESPWDDAIAGRLNASHPLEAMRRITMATDDPAEGARRFNEMVQAAIERFNDGSLVQASSMFDLAERILSERKLAPEVANSIRRRSHERLSEEHLRAFAEKPARHAQLRRVLGFFPALRSQGLLESLFQGEPRRGRRRLILALLEVHGASARTEVIEQLQRVATGGLEDPRGFYVRNLLFLLRRIPRSPEASLEKELDLLIPFSRPGNSVFVAKEAIWTLGQVPHPRAEQALMRRLEDYEDLLEKSPPGEDTTDLRGLLDKTVSTLARFGSQPARRAVVQHALRGNPALGDCMARVVELAGQDLSEDRELVELLVENIRNELPKKVLGLVFQKDGRSLAHLLRAISATTAPAVRQLLEEIVEKFPADEFARVAAASLAALGAMVRSPEAPAKILSGDLELFGLPNLFQSLSESRLSGTLTLSEEEGRGFATLVFDEGRVQRCENGVLRGATAFYQLFEKPIPGSFLFRAAGADRDTAGKGIQPGADEAPFEVLPAVLEALRRYDELQQARTLVPDDAPIKPAGGKPTRPDEEEDAGFLRTLWAKVSAGATAVECEATMPEDSYRIRRMLAHWVEEGALQIAAGAGRLSAAGQTS